MRRKSKRGTAIPRLGSPSSQHSSHLVAAISRQSTSHVSSISVDIHLTPAEARVLGSLIEKEITTPEYYPLSLNALLNACNQKSNRDPVMALDEDAAREALHSLNQHGFARSAATDGRVAKFEHRLQDTFNFHRHEIALLCVLLLRGAQTPGELRTRAERLYPFDDLNAVHSALNLLMRRDPPLAKVLPRQPGTKEARFVHLLSGDVRESAVSLESRALDYAAAPESPRNATGTERLSHLEDEVAALRSELAELKQQLASFQKQFQ
jgi:uncharacterized protein YceH (UPF0502 family)